MKSRTTGFMLLRWGPLGSSLLELGLLGVGLLGLGISGCGKDNLPDYTRLGDLRILTMKADQPEVSPGTTVSITPVLSDLSGAGRALSWEASGCLDPGVGYGAEPSCEGAKDSVSLGSGTVAPALAAPSYTAAVNSISVSIPSTALQNRSAIDQWNGVAYLVTYQVSAVDGTSVRSFKRVIVSTRTSKNSNPQIVDVLSGESAMSALPTSQSNLKVSLSTSSSESYEALTVDGRLVSRTEEMVTTWFVSDGDFERYRVTQESVNSYTPPTTMPSAHSVVIVTVVRDGRGGSDFKILSF